MFIYLSIPFNIYNTTVYDSNDDFSHVVHCTMVTHTHTHTHTPTTMAVYTIPDELLFTLTQAKHNDIVAVP